MEFSKKYKHFLKVDADFEFLEGTTASGKTTTGAIKFILKVLKNPKKDHILSGLDLGVIEKNIINAELGLLDIFGDHLKYYPNGYRQIKLPHLLIKDKIIYVLGYVDQSRWKKALGGQVGCVYIDEINIANMDYVREVSGRCDYMMATLNPDNPDLEIYTEYINKSRPLEGYESDYPTELLEMLNEAPEKDWIHWYFTFEHNAGMDEEAIAKKIRAYPKGTKIYKNKVLGLRGRATGLIFDFIPEKHYKDMEYAKAQKWQLFSVGIDTSYSSKSDDVFTLNFGGLTESGEWGHLKARGYNNKYLTTPLTPSDLAIKIDDFIMECISQWGNVRSVFIDSADQATIMETRKYARTLGRSYNIINSYKKTKIIDRINLQNSWMANGKMWWLKGETEEAVKEMNLYSWKETKDEPEDRNDHYINGEQYEWIPYKEKIGKEVKNVRENW